jgi:16S rRNA (cytosine967-C5)-methyltransferase
VDRTLAARAPVEPLLRLAEVGLDDRDRRLLRELSLGTLRWLRRLDDVIETASSRSLRVIDPRLRSPLRVAAYQLLLLDRIPAHAAVNEAVDEVRRRGGGKGAGFVNAVLRRIARQAGLSAWPVAETNRVRRLAVETSHPDRLVSRWLDQFGEAAARRLLDASNTVKPLHLLGFRHRGGRERLAARLAREGVVTKPSKLSPLGLRVQQGDPLTTECFRLGLFYVQDEASQAAALLPPPAVRERILDLAAAPGGKTFTLLACEPTVRIFAADLDPARLAVFRRNAARLQLGVPLVVGDAARPSWRAAFDRVVVDLPCSGTGTLRKHPELKWRFSEPELGRLCRQGAALVAAASALVVPGGVLSVISCSLEPEENEGMVEGFLREHEEFELEPRAADRMPALRALERAPGSWRILPVDGHDGFTIHVLRRRQPVPVAGLRSGPRTSSDAQRGGDACRRSRAPARCGFGVPLGDSRPGQASRGPVARSADLSVAPGESVR